jgi:hypothetical protein
MSNTKRTPIQQDEYELIAFHLGELCNERSIRARLQEDEEYAALSESVSHTLRVFSAEQMPVPNTKAAWQQLRQTLPVLGSAQRVSRWGYLLVISTVPLVTLIVMFSLPPRLLRRPSHPDAVDSIHSSDSRRIRGLNDASEHLDRVERWLTAVNHTPALLDAETRGEGEALLSRNAVYLSEARNRDDLAAAFALERLGRVLTTAHNAKESGVQIQTEMHTDGLLFDLRILQQNRSRLNGDTR